MFKTDLQDQRLNKTQITIERKLKVHEALRERGSSLPSRFVKGTYCILTVLNSILPSFAKLLCSYNLQKVVNENFAKLQFRVTEFQSGSSRHMTSHI